MLSGLSPRLDETRERKAGAWLWKKAAARFQRTSSSIHVFYRGQTDPKYSPAEPLKLRHRRGLIKEMAVKAMKKLGGEATSPELLNFIRDGSMWTKYGPELQKKLTKLNGNTYSLPIWERSVRTNVDKYFEATGRRRDGVMIYQLKAGAVEKQGPQRLEVL